MKKDKKLEELFKRKVMRVSIGVEDVKVEEEELELTEEESKHCSLPTKYNNYYGSYYGHDSYQSLYDM